MATWYNLKVFFGAHKVKLMFNSEKRRDMAIAEIKLAPRDFLVTITDDLHKTLSFNSDTFVGVRFDPPDEDDDDDYD